MQNFKICVQNPFQNCEKIYPIQQRKIQSIIEHLSGDPNVLNIIIFGSSVTNRCHIDSDVDLYIELGEDQPVIKKAFYFPYDLWTNFTVDKKLYEQIKETGVQVYEK